MLIIFCIQRECLLDEEAAPRDLATIASHLYASEPSNFGVVSLIRSRQFETVCKSAGWQVNSDDDEGDAKADGAVIERLSLIHI